MFVVVAKRTSMIDKQNYKRLPNNVCPFGRGFKRAEDLKCHTVLQNYAHTELKR